MPDPTTDPRSDSTTDDDPRATIELVVNGEPATAEVAGRTLLVDMLRDSLGLTGTHVGCDTSQCGCCTVHLNGEAVKSCTLLAQQAEGATVTTIEGIGTPGRLHPVQQAYSACHGLQCGFCTPGMIMATIALLDRHPDPTDEEIREGLSGNLCRCTGYVNIEASVRAAAAAMRSDAR
jgi:carbon-monoxide dehydrogenase small subunit